MKVSDVKKVCVAGGGQMGRQIALNAAIHGFDTYLTDAIAAVSYTHLTLPTKRIV